MCQLLKMSKIVDIMKKILFLLFASAMIVACDDGANKQNAELTSRNDSLQAVIAERDAAIEEMLAAINTVEEGFRAISEAQGRINVNEVGNEVSRKEALANEVVYINETLEKNRKEIARLQAMMKDNAKASKQLKTMIENLQAQLIEKSKEIDELHKALAEKSVRIEKLDETVEALTQIKDENEQTISQQDSELNAVWYAVGTKRELKDMNILKSGDVLRETDANMDYFTKADMRELSSVNTYASKAKLLTSHPEGSYTLERNAEKQYVLTITDATAFWSVSRYLVIQVR